MVKLNNISYSYYTDTPLKKQVLRGVSLSLRKGEHVSLVGNSGSGKSTLAKIICGILKPTEGLVTWSLDKDIVEPPGQGRTVGMVLQNPENQIILGTVMDEVAFGLENMEVPPKEIERKVENILRSLNLWDKKDYPTSFLSGGEKQKLALASILVMEPDCLILDEATALLDYNSKKIVLETIKHLKKAKGITILQITSSIEEVMSSERVILLDKGKIRYDGEVSLFLIDEGVRGMVGFDLPALLAISQELIQKGYIKELCYSTEELAEKLLWEYQFRV